MLNRTCLPAEKLMNDEVIRQLVETNDDSNTDG